MGASPQLKIQTDRYGGYCSALEMHGLPYDPVLIAEGDLTTEGGFRAGSYLLALPDPPTAIACVDDMTAIGVLHAAREYGRQVGQDLAVAGFDGIEGFEHTQPPLSTVNQPVYQIARRLAQMLACLITAKPLDETQVQIEPVLEIRQSTAGPQMKVIR